MLIIQGKQYITTKAAGEITGYGESYIQRLAKQNKIEGIKIGPAWAIEKESIMKYAANTNPPAAKLSIKMNLKAIQLGHKMRKAPDGRVHCIYCGESIKNIYEGKPSCKKQ